MMAESQNEKRGLIFGIYPGSGVGIDPGSGAISGAADDPAAIKTALDALQPDDRPFLVRGYMHYVGSGKRANTTPADMIQYVSGQRKLDLALCYRPPESDLGGWTDFIGDILAEYGPYLAKIQITEEPNNPHAATGGDGSSPDVLQAIIAGVLAAKEEIQKKGAAIEVGFNATLSFDPENSFWKAIARLSRPGFLEALDYVGLDFYPDVFRPLPPGVAIRDAVTGVLTHFRTVNVAAGGIPATVPIHITENGWPTSAARSYERQAAVIEEVIRAVDQKKAELNITHYEYFDLRDANSADPGLQFGLLQDNYSPKPGFEVFRKLILELGGGG